MISVQDAQVLVGKSVKLLATELIDIEFALGRTLAEDVGADRDYPPFNRAAMDGYAFRYKESLFLTAWNVAGHLLAGNTWKEAIQEGHCLKIMTGAATPVELDCLVQVELASVSDNKVSFPQAMLKSGLNIAKRGEDCRKGELIIKAGTELSPIELATLAVLGKKEIKVSKPPKVAIVSTGDELVPVGMPIADFQIRDSNAHALSAFFQAIHVPVSYKTIVKDNRKDLDNVLGELSSYDIILLSGGVSMGDADYVPQALEQIGVQKIFHKVQLKPGKPLWFGQQRNRGVVFGLPGNPLSCQVCFKVFIEPFVRKCLGQTPSENLYFPLNVGRAKKVQLDEYFPVKFQHGTLSPILFNGSGDVTSTLGSTGIALHPIDSSDLKDGSEVLYVPWV